MRKRGQMFVNKSDILGKYVGSLEVIGYSGHRYTHTAGGDKLRHYYTCRCTCGNTIVVRRDALVDERTNSCGCSRNKSNKSKNNRCHLVD